MKLMFCLVIGSCFALRTTKKLIAMGYISHRSSLFPFIVCSILLIPWVIVGQQATLTIWILGFVQFLGPNLFFASVERARRQQFHQETSRFFDQLLLGVRSGNSVREVIRGVSDNSDFGFHTREISAAVLQEDGAISRIRTADFRMRATEIHKLLHSGSKVSERIGALRRKYRMIERFRRKSRLATQPVTAQIIVILVLYVALITLRVVEDPQILRSGWFFISSFLVFAGIFAIQMMKGAFKWKI